MSSNRNKRRAVIDRAYKGIKLPAKKTRSDGIVIQEAYDIFLARHLLYDAVVRENKSCRPIRHVYSMPEEAPSTERQAETAHVLQRRAESRERRRVVIAELAQHAR